MNSQKPMYRRSETGRGLDGEYFESELPLLIQRRGMATWEDGIVRILDRRRLPHERFWIDCTTVEEVATAIEEMAIQGAFTIAIAAGYGLALALRVGVPMREDWMATLSAASERLVNTRPTGLAMRRVLSAALKAAETKHTKTDALEAILCTVERSASVLAQQAMLTGRRANALVPDGATVLTHCFADRSFLYFLLEAQRAGKRLKIFSSETRPFLQGTRLTSMSVAEIGVPVTLVTDGMSGLLFRARKADVLMTAADRVCLDGTICNKIGTYQHALAAAAADCPYYVLRQSGPDAESEDERDIEIEYREGDAILTFDGRRMAPHGVNALYPAFDITPPELITSIVTDRGIFVPSDIRKYFELSEVVPSAIA